MSRQFYQGKYIVENAQKYEGDSSNVCFRSSWEFRAFKYCDASPKIISWSSEEVIIPYKSPLDKRVHRYFMDLKVTQIDEYGLPHVTLIEIKPDKETRPPVKKGKNNERYIKEMKTYITNQAKWQAARMFCQKKGWSFVIWTEKNLLPESDASVKTLKAQRTYEEKMKKSMKKTKSVAQQSAIRRTKQLIQGKLIASREQK